TRTASESRSSARPAPRGARPRTARRRAAGSSERARAMDRPVFHRGELAVQAIEGTLDEARRVGASVHDSLPPAVREFARGQRFAVAASIDAAGRVWASPLVGEPGLLDPVSEREIRVTRGPVAGDPLRRALAERGEMGLLVIDLATRRRMKVKGRGALLPGGEIALSVERGYSLCPKYIQMRVPMPGGAGASRGDPVPLAGSLDAEQRRLVDRADTFFIATFHTETGADASHRGGNPGFVRATDASTIV